MPKLAEGIWRLDGQLASPGDKPLLVMHPWCYGFDARYDLFEFPDPDHCAQFEFDPSGQYLDNIMTLLRSCQGEIVVLEENSKVGRARSELEGRLERRAGIYLVGTISGCPIPVTENWRAFLNLTRSFGEEVVLAGGYLRSGDISWTGCLGGLYHQLRDFGINGEFVSGCCFESAI